MASTTKRPNRNWKKSSGWGRRRGGKEVAIGRASNVILIKFECKSFWFEMHIKVNYFRRSGVEREQRELNVCGKFGWSPLPLLILSPLLAALIEPISVCVCVWVCVEWASISQTNSGCGRDAAVAAALSQSPLPSPSPSVTEARQAMAIN